MTVQLPGLVLDALAALPEREGPYYFWTGKSARQTCAKYWRVRLGQIAGRAGVRAFHPHRLRDHSESRIIPS